MRTQQTHTQTKQDVDVRYELSVYILTSAYWQLSVTIFWARPRAHFTSKYGACATPGVRVCKYVFARVRVAAAQFI